MFGLMVFGAMGMYLLLSIGVVIWAISYARKHGKSAKCWGWGAVFVMYNLVFWDWLPTVAVHQYYCATESGFWVYKPLDQWKAENPGWEKRLHFKIQTSRTPYGTKHALNERFLVEFHQKKPLSLLPTTVTEERLVDIGNGNVLAKAIRVGSYVSPAADGLRGYKFWLGLRPCVSEGLGNFTAEIEHMGETK
jgi:hypothetical protein